MSEYQDRTQHRRKAVLVLGMHRSGTSALSRILNMLGCDLPLTLMDGAASNIHGHWESAAAMNLNDAVLAAGGSGWDDWLPFDRDWYETPIADDFLRQGVDVIREEYGNSPLFVLKDPRNCRLLPFWREVLHSEEIDPLISIPIRNPIEVAQSLAARNNMPLAVGLLLWLRHVLDAEFDSRGLPRVFSAYEQLLQNWADPVARLEEEFGLSWPLRSPAVEKQVEGFLDPGSRHHVHSSQSLLSDPCISDWVRSVYATMLRWAETGQDEADYAGLDSIRQAFDAAAPAFAGLTDAVRQSREEVRQLREELERTPVPSIVLAPEPAPIPDQTETTHAAEQAREQGAALERAGQEIDDLNRRIIFLESKLDYSEEQGAGLRKSFERALKDIEVTRRGQEEALFQSKEQAKVVERLEADAARVRSELASEQAELAVQKAETEWQTLRSHSLEEEKLSLSRRLADHRAQQGEAETELAAVLKRCQHVEEQLGVAEASQTMLARGLEEAHDKAKRSEQERAADLARLEALSGELQGLQARLRDRDAEVQALGQSSADAEANAKCQAEIVEWLMQVKATMDHAPAWWALMPAAWRHEHEKILLTEHDLFNADAYLRQNPDVAAAGLDPLHHYITHGIREGRAL